MTARRRIAECGSHAIDPGAPAVRFRPPAGPSRGRRVRAVPPTQGRSAARDTGAVNEVVFPRSADGRRSSAALGRAVVADALRVVDPAAADAAARETDWRRGYLRHFRALVEAGLRSDGTAAYEIAAAGLASVRDRMRTGRRPVARRRPGRDGGGRPLETVARAGQRHARAGGGPAVPRRAAARRRAGPAAGRLGPGRDVIEESCAEAVREVAANPDWLDLSDQRLVVLGAGAEMGPLPAVLGWGAHGGRRRPAPARSCGTGCARSPQKSAGPADRAGRRGADLLTELPAVARLAADRHRGPAGAGQLRVRAGRRVRPARPPRWTRSACTSASSAPTWRSPCWPPRPTSSRCPARPCRSPTPASARGPAAPGSPARSSGGRLLQPNYPDGAGPGHQRQPGPAAGPELRAGQADPAVAGDGRPARRRGELLGGAADPDPVGARATG